MEVQLRTEMPVFSAVLTPQQFHESAAHFEFFRKHFVIKGIEVAEACAKTLHSLERLRGQVAAGIVLARTPSPSPREGRGGAGESWSVAAAISHVKPILRLPLGRLSFPPPRL